jgi:hypothetical protein
LFLDRRLWPGWPDFHPEQFHKHPQNARVGCIQDRAARRPSRNGT